MKRLVLLFLFVFSSLFSQNKYEEGERLYNAKKLIEAQKIYTLLYTENPKDLFAIERLGDIAVAKTEWEKAKLYFQKLILYSPKNANYHYKYGGAVGLHAKNCNKFKALGMLDEIENSFLKAIILDPKHIDARKALVTYYLEVPGIVGGSVTKAKAYAKELSQLSVKDGQWANAQIQNHLN